MPGISAYPCVYHCEILKNNKPKSSARWETFVNINATEPRQQTEMKQQKMWSGNGTKTIVLLFFNISQRKITVQYCNNNVSLLIRESRLQIVDRALDSSQLILQGHTHFCPFGLLGQVVSIHDYKLEN